MDHLSHLPTHVINTLLFCASLLHLLMWLTVSSLSPQDLHLLFCCLPSIFLYHNHFFFFFLFFFFFYFFFFFFVIYLHVYHSRTNWWSLQNYEWQQIFSASKDSSKHCSDLNGHNFLWIISSPFSLSRFFRILPRAQTMTDITVTSIFHKVLARSWFCPRVSKSILTDLSNAAV